MAIAEGILMAVPKFLGKVLQAFGVFGDATDVTTKKISNSMEGLKTNIEVGGRAIDTNLDNMKANFDIASKSMTTSTKQLTQVTSEVADGAQKRAQLIVNSAEAADKLASVALHSIIVGFDSALKSVQSTGTELSKTVDKIVEKMRELSDIDVNPSVDPSGVEAGCNAIVEACNKAINALTRLSQANSGGGGFGGGHASGGWMNPGTTYLVGELGPELVTPSRGGYITISGDVYDDERSMRQKMKSAMLSVLQEQVSYG